MPFRLVGSHRKGYRVQSLNSKRYFSKKPLSYTRAYRQRAAIEASIMRRGNDSYYNRAPNRKQNYDDYDSDDDDYHNSKSNHHYNKQPKRLHHSNTKKYKLVCKKRSQNKKYNMKCFWE